MDWNKKSERKKMGAVGLVLLLLLCTVAGCGKKEKKEETTKETFCAAASMFDCWSGRAFCDKGMLQVENGVMIFYEYETGRSYPLCSDVYCEHQPYDASENPDPVCEATMRELETACIYGDYVYTIQQTEIQEITIQERNLNESGYRVVAKLPYCQTFSSQGFNAIIGDKAYLLLAEIDNLTDDGVAQSYTSNDLYTFLVELDLKTGEYRTLFHIEGEEKYKILQTVYTEEGIYCRCYYEDIVAEETSFTLNDYWEKFYYVSYDGSQVKELCPELTEATTFRSGVLPEITVVGISETGVYFLNTEMTKVECVGYDNKRETVFELPEGYTRLKINGISGNKMLMTLTTSGKSSKLAGLDLVTGELLMCDKTDDFIYTALCEEAFWKSCEGEMGMYKELWICRDIFSEDGKPLLSVIE